MGRYYIHYVVRRLTAVRIRLCEQAEFHFLKASSNAIRFPSRTSMHS